MAQSFWRSTRLWLELTSLSIQALFESLLSLTSCALVTHIRRSNNPFLMHFEICRYWKHVGVEPGCSALTWLVRERRTSSALPSIFPCLLHPTLFSASLKAQYSLRSDLCVVPASISDVDLWESWNVIFCNLSLLGNRTLAFWLRYSPLYTLWIASSFCN